MRAVSSMTAFYIIFIVLLCCLGYLGVSGSAGAQSAAISNISVNSVPAGQNSWVNVTYMLANATGDQVYLQVYDPGGLIVRTIDAGLQSNGVHTITWNGCYYNGTQAPAGNYTLRVFVDDAGSVTNELVSQWPISKFSLDTGYGVAVAPNGILYVNDGGSNIDMMYPNGTLGQSMGAFSSLGFMASDPSGDLIATDMGTNAVNIIYPNSTIKQLGNGHNFNWPRGVAVDTQGNIYVTEMGDDFGAAPITVDEIYTNGTLKTLASGDALEGDEGVAVGSNGNIYVSDASGIVVVYPGGSCREFSPIAADDVASDAAGNMYITDSNNSSLDMLDSNGALAMQVANPNADDGNQLGVTTDSMGDVYTTDGSHVYEFARPYVTSGLLNISYTNNVAQPALASFSANVTSGMAPLTVQFTDTSSNSPSSWSWSFGDGNTSTAQDPVYTYCVPGVYNVSLSASNAAGGNTVTQAGFITVSQSPAEVPFLLNLSQGWDLVSFPVANSSLNASSLDGTGVSVVSGFNASSGGYDSFIEGISPAADDFRLSSGTGYFMYCPGNASLVVYGYNLSGRSVTINPGWNMIGWSSFNGSTAEDVCDALSGSSVVVSEFNVSSGDYNSFIGGVSPDAYNFALSPGLGYFVFVNSTFSQTFYFDNLTSRVLPAWSFTINDNQSEVVNSTLYNELINCSEPYAYGLTDIPPGGSILLEYFFYYYGVYPVTAVSYNNTTYDWYSMVYQYDDDDTPSVTPNGSIYHAGTWTQVTNVNVTTTPLMNVSTLDLAPSILYALNAGVSTPGLLPNKTNQVVILYIDAFGYNWYQDFLNVSKDNFTAINDSPNQSIISNISILGTPVQAMCVYPSFTNPNCKALLTGVGPNLFKGDFASTEPDNETIFDVLNARGMTAAWIDTSYLVVDVNNSFTCGTPGAEVNEALQQYDDGTNLTVIHFDQFDKEVDEYGPSSTEAEGAVQQVDAEVGQILSHLNNGTEVIVWADHGCHPTKDGGNHYTLVPDDMYIPIIVYTKT